jgi:hypothetical protein
MLPVIGIYEHKLIVMRIVASPCKIEETPEHLAYKQFHQAYYSCTFSHPYKICLSCSFCAAVKVVGYLILTPTTKSPR